MQGLQILHLPSPLKVSFYFRIGHQKWHNCPPFPIFLFKSKFLILDKSSPIVPQVVQIQGFKSKGVQLTWFWIQGYEILLSKCEDFDTLSDMLAFADFYDIQRPVEAIAKQIEAVEINDANLIAALAAVEKLEKIEVCKEIAIKLETRSKDFAESFFNTPKKVSVFVTTNADNIHLVLRLLLKCDNFTVKNCRRCGRKPQSNGYCNYCGVYC